MELGDYFGKVFSKIFHKDLYWSTFVLALIYGIFLVVALIIGFFAFGGIALLNLVMSASANADPIAMQSNILSMVGALVGFFVFFGILMLFSMYFMDVMYCFTISRIPATDKKKSLDFFEGLGSAFGKGFMLFLAHLIYLIIIGLILVVIWAILIWIPILGWIIGALLTIVLVIYAMTGMLLLVGKIANGESFGAALGTALTKPFTSMRLVGYAVVLGLVLCVASFILGLLGMIPILGQIVMLFAGVAMQIYFCVIAYYFALEK